MAVSFDYQDAELCSLTVSLQPASGDHLRQPSTMLQGN